MIARIKSLGQKPAWRTLLFICFVLLFYYTRTRTPDIVQDMQIFPGRAFLALGDTGVVLLDLTNPIDPVEIAVYDTSGKASGLEVAGDLIYVADGPAGLKVLSLARLGETGALERVAHAPTPRDALDVALYREYVFVASLDAGVAVFRTVDKNNKISLEALPALPVEISGRAEHLVVAGPYLFVSTNNNTLVVLDISNPQNIVSAGEIALPETIRDFVVDIHNSRVYAATGKGGLQILDISKLPGEIEVAAQFTAPSEVYDVALRGPYAYVAAGRDGYYVLDVSNQAVLPTLGHQSSPRDANQIGILDEYVYVADGRDGLRVFESPIVFNFRPRNTVGNAGNFEDVLVANTLAYIAAGEGGLQIVNVEKMERPLNVPYEDGLDDYATALDLENGQLYVTYRRAGLRIYDITADPALPAFADLQVAIPGEATDVAMDGAFAFITGGDSGLHVVDLSNIAMPQTHSVDTPGRAQGVFVLGDYAYVADGGAGIQIVSIANPRAPQIVSAVETAGEAVSVVVAWQATQSGEQRLYAFIADGPNGLFIVDVTEPNHPVAVATYETAAFVNDVTVSGQTVYLGERDEGVIVLDISLISDPKMLGVWNTPGQARGLHLGGNQRLYVADGTRGLRIVSVENPLDPQERGALDSPKSADTMVVQGGRGYLVDGGDGLWVLDLADPGVPQPLTFYQTPGQAKDLAVQGGRAYIADGSAGLQIVDLHDEQPPTFVGEYREIQDAQAVVVQGEIAYVLSSDNKLHILNLTNPAEIWEESVYQTAAPPLNAGIWHSYLYIVEGNQGLEIINVENRRRPVQVTYGHDLGLQDSLDISVMGDWRRLFIADGRVGLKVLDNGNPAAPELVFLHAFDGGFVTGLAVNANYLFASVGNWGVAVFDAYNTDRLVPVGEYRPLETEEGTPPFQANSIAVANTSSDTSRRVVVYVPAGAQGLQVFQADGRMEVWQTGLYETPGEKTLVHAIYMAFGTLLFFLFTIFWMLLLAQFVLPTQTFGDGFQAFKRLLASLWGRHGPVVFVREGKIVARPGELERWGLGVARVDLNSAIVLRQRAWRRFRGWSGKRPAAMQDVASESEIGLPDGQEPRLRAPKARVEGPGIVFFHASEKIHGAVDLRPQFRIRPKVRANTREGIEIESLVWALFTLGQPPDVLDVTYQGERIPENLRVITLKSQYTKQRRVVAVKRVADELDLEDKQEIHRYVQNQQTARYFTTAKSLANRLLDSKTRAKRPMYAYSRRISGLARRWGVAGHEPVKQFVIEVRALMKHGEAEGMHLHWFVYQVCMMADIRADARMELFYWYLRPRMAARYQQRLRSLSAQSEFEFARDQMREIAGRTLQNGNEAVDINALNRLAQDALALYDDIREATETRLAEIEGDSATNERELRLAALERLRAITENLFRRDFPALDAYRAFAELTQNFADMQPTIQGLHIRGAMRFPNFWTFWAIRRGLRSLQRDVAKLGTNSQQQCDVYLDRLEIDRYVSQIRDALHEFQRVPDRDRLRARIARVRWQTDLLKQISSRPFQRLAHNLIGWAASLDESDDAQVYFFAQRVDDFVDRIADADRRTLRDYMRKTRDRVKKIRAALLKFETKTRTLNRNGEIERYRQSIAALRSLVGRCHFPRRLVDPPQSACPRKQVGPFHFDPRRVLAAAYSQALDRDRSATSEYMPWTDLPVHVAVQTFRDMVSREQYDNLYAPDNASRYQIPQLKANLRVRMRNQGVLAFRFVDHIDRKALDLGSELDDSELVYYEVQELKTPKVLRARGIKVIAAGFPDLFPVSPQVPGHLLDLWRAPLQSQMVEIRSAYELQAARIINQRRAEAQREMAFTLARILRSSRSDEALAMRVFQALEAIAGSADTRQFLPRDTAYLLRSFRRWFLNDSSEAADDRLDELGSPDEPHLSEDESETV